MAEAPYWLREICDRLRESPSKLISLNLNLRRFSVEWMRVFADALRENNSVVDLNLTSSIRGDPEALTYLADRAICQHGSVVNLMLQYNELRDVSALSRALETNMSVRRLDLGHNKLTSNDVGCLVPVLVENRLEELSLHYNDISDEGCIAMASVLAKNTSLRCLRLNGNPLSESGLGALRTLLSSNCTLCHLALSSETKALGLVSEINLLVRANKAGRSMLSLSPPLALWPRVLARCGSDVDVLFFFLQSKPELVRTSKKRKLARD